MTTALADAPQHVVALRQANEVRLARAAIKRSIEAGEMTVGAILRDVPACCETMAVGDLIRAQRRWGPTRMRKFLNGLDVFENRALGRLTVRQRALIADALADRA